MNPGLEHGMNKPIVITFWLLSVILAAMFLPVSFGASADDAKSSVSRAEYDLGLAFNLVAKAERKGANVSQLLNELVTANDMLSKADFAIRAGDYDTANSLAVDCGHIVENVVAQWAPLNANAETSSRNELLFTVIVSDVGLVLLLIFGFLGWKLLKKKYRKQVMRMKPRLGNAR
jgi:hypothetical protein